MRISNGLQNRSIILEDEIHSGATWAVSHNIVRLCSAARRKVSNDHRRGNRAIGLHSNHCSGKRVCSEIIDIFTIDLLLVCFHGHSWSNTADGPRYFGWSSPQWRYRASNNVTRSREISQNRPIFTVGLTALETGYAFVYGIFLSKAIRIKKRATIDEMRPLSNADSYWPEKIQSMESAYHLTVNSK